MAPEDNREKRGRLDEDELGAGSLARYKQHIVKGYVTYKSCVERSSHLRSLKHECRVCELPLPIAAPRGSHQRKDSLSMSLPMHELAPQEKSPGDAGVF